MLVRVLIQEGVIQEGNIYDFHRCHSSLMMIKTTLDRVKGECERMEESVKGIQSKILISLEELSGQEMNEEDGLDLEELKKKVKSVYFQRLKSVQESQLNDILSFMIFISHFQRRQTKWEKTLEACSDQLDVVDLQLDALPSVAIEELESIMSRFIAYGIRERDKGNKVLEDLLEN